MVQCFKTAQQQENNYTKNKVKVIKEVKGYN